MKRVTVQTAKAQLAKLIDLACAGEDVEIARGRTGVVSLTAIYAPPTWTGLSSATPPDIVSVVVPNAWSTKSPSGPRSRDDRFHRSEKLREKSRDTAALPGAARRASRGRTGRGERPRAG